MTMRFVRRKKDGVSGEVVEANGVKVFRIQVSPLETKDEPFKESNFTEDYPERMLNPIQVGKIAFEADKILREAFGDYSVQKDFRQLEQGDRMRWVSGPDFSKGHPARKRLYDAVKKALEPDTQPM